ncbi:MAG: hypothetical protein M0R03_22915 [Novosphingobium sp.]|nr:hypothetical protein [Novosphingobium sp.]
MKKINYIEKTKDGRLLVDYYNNGYKFMYFLGYTKREALKIMRKKLDIKRNPTPIIDYTVTPKPTLTESLNAWAATKEEWNI